MVGRRGGVVADIVEVVHKQQVGRRALSDFGHGPRLRVVQRGEVGEEIAFDSATERRVESGGADGARNRAAGQAGGARHSE